VKHSRTLAGIVCSFGGFIFGYDLGALSAVVPTLRETFYLSPLLLGTSVAASLFGTIGGSISAGRVADRVGTPRLIGSCAALYFIATLIASSSPPVWLLFICMRILNGVAIGGISVACPLYLSEIAPPRSRGLFVGAFQLQIGIGILIAFIVGVLVARFTMGGSYWRICLGGGALPAIFLLASSRAMVSVPHWLAEHRRVEDADQAADQLGMSEQEWPRNQKTNYLRPAVGPATRLFSRRYLRPILLATLVALFNQLSGVNVLLLYLLDVLSSAGFNTLLSHRYTVLISMFSLGITILSMRSVDKFGRRPVLLVGSLGLAACLAALGTCIPLHLRFFWYLIILVAYNGFFSFSQGTLVWIYLTELFPLGVRGAGQGYGTTVHWIANAILVLVFPAFQRAKPSLSFYFLSAMMIVQILAIFLWYPETKGKELGEVAVDH
jgi:SP family arabinose:H+ symporter-like MFS transporter